VCGNHINTQGSLAVNTKVEIHALPEAISTHCGRPGANHGSLHPHTGRGEVQATLSHEFSCRMFLGVWVPSFDVLAPACHRSCSPPSHDTENGRYARQ
jgi:hypothetical protein